MKNKPLIAILAGMLLGFSTMVLASDLGSLKGTVRHASVKRAPTVIYIEEMPGQTFTPPKKHPVMDQTGKVFVPAVLPVLVGTTVEFLNNDDFEHNVFSPDGEKYDLGKWGKGKSRTHTFERPGVYAQLCRIHPEMIAYVLVLKTPYFAIANRQGEFTLPGLPPGTWKLKVWNERLRSKQLKKEFQVTVQAGQTAPIDISF